MLIYPVIELCADYSSGCCTYRFGYILRFQLIVIVSSKVYCQNPGNILSIPMSMKKRGDFFSGVCMIVWVSLCYHFIQQNIPLVCIKNIN